MLRQAVIVSFVCGASASALAQVAPPPTEKPPGLQRPVRPPPVLPPDRKQELVDDRRREFEREQRRKAIEAEQRRAPPLPYESLVVRGEDAAVVVLDEPTEFIALQRNPMVAQIKRDRLNALAAERRQRVEARVVERMDLFDQLVLQGGVNRVRAADRASLSLARSNLAEFTIDNGLTSWLNSQGHITRPQALFSNLISAEYGTALQQQRLANPPADESPTPNVTDLLARHYLSLELAEYEIAYERLVDRLVQLIVEGNPSIPSDIRSAAMQAADRRASVAEQLLAMPMDERADVLRLALR